MSCRQELSIGTNIVYHFSILFLGHILDQLYFGTICLNHPNEEFYHPTRHWAQNQLFYLPNKESPNKKF